MEKNIREELERFYHQYIQTLEDQDIEGMNELWMNDPQTRAVSIYGVSDGFDEIKQNIETHLQGDIKEINMISNEMEVINASDDHALVYLTYTVILVYKNQKQAHEQNIIETQYLKRDASGKWKIEYQHQSIPNIGVMQSDSLNQSKIIDEMLELINGNQSRPRSLKERRHLLEHKLGQLTSEEITPKLIELQNQLIALQKQHTALTALAFIMSEDQKISVWTGDASRLTVDCLISFMKSSQSYDPWLSKSAGLGLQKENLNHLHLNHSKTWVSGNYNLPVKGVIEVSFDPIYGLYTDKKQEAFRSALHEAIDKANARGYKSIAIMPGWKDVLNIPSAKGSEQLVSEVINRLEDPESTLNKAVLVSSRGEQARALQSTIDDFEE